MSIPDHERQKYHHVQSLCSKENKQKTRELNPFPHTDSF